MDYSFLCWYVQTTGIWKTVWTEYVPKCRIDRVKMTPNMEDYCLELEFDVNAPESSFGSRLWVEAEVSFDERLVSRTMCAITSGHMIARADMFERDIFSKSLKKWSPKTPNLYDITFRLIYDGEVIDEVGSYAAMREIRIEGSDILLNGRPLYQRLILDQGYWKDSRLD